MLKHRNPGMRGPKPRSKNTLWIVLLVSLSVMACGLALLMVFGHRHTLPATAADESAPSPAPAKTVAPPRNLPSWPLKAGDVLPILPGDARIAKWAEQPANDGFIVQQVAQNGQPLPELKVCALEPDYMADADQPGGSLTVLSQELGTGDWRIHWQGGDTLPPSVSDNTRNANCGHDAVVTMSQAQLHSWLNMQAGTTE